MLADPSPEAADNALQAFTESNQGNHQAAIDRLRPFAERDEPWAVGLLCFIYQQQGAPGMEPGFPWAIRGLEMGMPWVAWNFFNHLVGQLAALPNMVDRAVDLMRRAASYPWGPADPISAGWNLLSQQHGAAAIQVMNTATVGPFDPTAWTALTANATEQVHALRALGEDAKGSVNAVKAEAEQHIEAMKQTTADLETKVKQLDLLVDTTSASAVNSLYDAEATANARESTTAWRWGIGVLISAAVVAVLPLALHYLDHGPDYSNNGLLLAHAGSTAALATVAGVLLARARGRDHIRQRAKDLSTAMGTMIVYSGQIQDPGEKQQFIQTMGQLILEAHLRGDGAPKEDSMVGLAALLTALRGPGS